jgi:hypothetical protein
MGSLSPRGRARSRDRVMRVLLVVVVVALLVSMMLTVRGGGSRAASAGSSSAPSQVHAAVADIAFGEPTVTGSLTQPIVYSTTFQATTPPDRIELLTRVRGGTVDSVQQASVRQGSDGSWSATVPSIGFTPPNTVEEVRFRAVAGNASVLGPTTEFTVVDDRFEWHTMTDGPVTLHWDTGDETFARHALEVGVHAIDQAAELLGVADVQPVDFFVYDTSEALYGAMGPGTRENVGGQANPLIRTMVGVIRPEDVDSDWVDVLVTHELTHMVFSDATDNPYRQPPRWLNEGLAVYLAEGYSVGDRAQVADAAGRNALTPLSAIAGLFPTTYDRFSLAYAQSVSAVDFFIDTYGRDTLVRLIGSYRDGVTDDEAFEAATGADFRAFDDAWLAAQGVTRPDPYGPQPAPLGPQPADWQGTGVATPLPSLP